MAGSIRGESIKQCRDGGLEVERKKVTEGVGARYKNGNPGNVIVDCELELGSQLKGKARAQRIAAALKTGVQLGRSCLGCFALGR